jgi:hypothetical protein
MPQFNPETHEWLEADDEEEARARIFEMHDIEEELLPVPEWHMHILIRALTGAERAHIMQTCTNQKTGEVTIAKAYPDLVIMASRHPTNKKLIFKKPDRDMLLTKAGKALDRIALKVMELSGMTEEAQQLLTKNSNGQAANGASTSS